MAASKRSGPPQETVVINAETGAIVYATKGALSRPVDPASITKMMSLYVVLEAQRAGQLNNADMITLSKAAAALDNNSFGYMNRNGQFISKLPAGSKLSVADAKEALANNSANGVTKALLESTPMKQPDGTWRTGSEAEVAAYMTAKARSWGLDKTTFKNTTGLNGMYGQAESTAYELAVVMQHLNKDFPEFRDQISSQRTHAQVMLPKAKRPLKINTASHVNIVHELSEQSKTAERTGMTIVNAKTGLNSTSKYNLASVIKKTSPEGQEQWLAVVTVGNTSSAAAMGRTIAAAKQSYKTISAPDAPLEQRMAFNTETSPDIAVAIARNRPIQVSEARQVAAEALPSPSSRQAHRYDPVRIAFRETARPRPRRNSSPQAVVNAIPEAKIEPLPLPPVDAFNAQSTLEAPPATTTTVAPTAPPPDTKPAAPSAFDLIRQFENPFRRQPQPSTPTTL